MKKKQAALIFAVGLLIVLGISIVLPAKDPVIAPVVNPSEAPATTLPATNSAATNDEELIDQAIKEKNPALCEQVKNTTRPGPRDEPMPITGQEAIDVCKYQVELGHRIHGG